LLLLLLFHAVYIMTQAFRSACRRN